MKVISTEKIKSCACDCGKIITETDKYGRKHSFVNGHNGRKYKDLTQYKREWNHRNRKKRTEYRKIQRRKRKGILIQYKGGKCQNCNIKYNYKNGCIFDFHHCKGKKLFGISGNVMEKSIEKLKKEADKCLLLCSNCHRPKHSEEY